MKLTYQISELVPYINWPYFFFAWQVKEASEKQRLQAEAESVLAELEGRYHAYALFELLDAHSDGDDIMVYSGDRRQETGVRRQETGVRSQETEVRSQETEVRSQESGDRRIPCLRQQQAGSDYLCLSDFIAPLNISLTSHLSPLTSHLSPLTSHLLPLTSQIGLFATTVDIGMETDFEHDAYQKMMVQLLADRLAEAAAERMHEQVRKVYWGYAKNEQLSIADMLVEKFQGIRPAVGYPSLPDTSLNFVLDELLDMKQIGIRLTESGAMKPHASVSGLMIANPRARYFSIGKIGEDQLHDYARRRGIPIELCRKFLAGNL